MPVQQAFLRFFVEISTLPAFAGQREEPSLPPSGMQGAKNELSLEHGALRSWVSSRNPPPPTPCNRTSLFPSFKWDQYPHSFTFALTGLLASVPTWVRGMVRTLVQGRGWVQLGVTAIVAHTQKSPRVGLPPLTPPLLKSFHWVPPDRCSCCFVPGNKRIAPGQSCPGGQVAVWVHGHLPAPSPPRAPSISEEPFPGRPGGSVG